MKKNFYKAFLFVGNLYLNFWSGETKPGPGSDYVLANDGGKLMDNDGNFIITDEV